VDSTASGGIGGRRSRGFRAAAPSGLKVI
jgi:hypothetical protein